MTKDKKISILLWLNLTKCYKKLNNNQFKVYQNLNYLKIYYFKLKKKMIKVKKLLWNL